MAFLSYMQRRRSGTYEFRRRLPEALAGRPVPAHMRDAFAELINSKTGCFKRELVRSLGTKEGKEAKRQDHREALRASALFDDAVAAMTADASPMTLRDADLKAIEAEVLAELLATDESEREDGDDRRRLQTAEDRAKWPDLEPAVPLAPNMPAPSLPASHIKGMAKDHHLAYGDLLVELEAEYREALARHDATIVRAETQTALKRRGIPIDRSSSAFQAAGMAVLRAHVRAYDAMQRRQSGDVIATPEPRTSRGPRLSEAFLSWKVGGNHVRGAKKPAKRTVEEAEQVVRCFREFHGDLHLGDIGRKEARAFRDALARVPVGLPKRLRKLPLPKLLERDLQKLPTRSATTVNKLITLIGAVVSHAQRAGLVDHLPGFVNPFDKNIRFTTDEQDGERAIFDKADLRAIFGGAIFTQGSRPKGGGGEAAFWFPLIGLLSGMRLDEIAQMRISDLRQDDDTGRWFFDVSRAGGRSTKSASSVRRVPLHRELERIGLLAYRNTMLDGGAAHTDGLWPHVKAANGRQRSAAWSKWFGRHLRQTIGITDPAKVFHSFRHTFKRMCRDAGLEEEIHDAFTGHAGPNGVDVGRGYGKGVSIGPLIAAMDRVPSPIDLSSIAWRPGTD